MKKEKCIGDFTPTYLFDKYAPERILSSLGKNVKFIIILRNPVDRAYSHYLHSKRDLHPNYKELQGESNSGRHSPNILAQILF